MWAGGQADRRTERQTNKWPDITKLMFAYRIFSNARGNKSNLPDERNFRIMKSFPSHVWK